MNLLFDQLSAEVGKIERDHATLSKIAEEARVNKDIETLKECIHKQREYTNRLKEILRMMKQIQGR